MAGRRPDFNNGLTASTDRKPMLADAPAVKMQ